MSSDLAQRLCRHAATVVDPSIRAALFRALVSEVSDEDLRTAVGSLSVNAVGGAPHARVALLSLQVALMATPERQRRLLDVREERGEPDVEAAPEEDDRRIPDYGRGRVLTLGERKSLARRPDRRMFDRVLRDPHPDVIALLLQNPRLTEPDVVRLCARRPAVPEVLARVFASPRWSLRPAVRRALAMNPATPQAVAVAVLPLLTYDELRAIRADEHSPAVVAIRCDEILAAMSRDPDAPALPPEEPALTLEEPALTLEEPVTACRDD